MPEAEEVYPSLLSKANEVAQFFKNSAREDRFFHIFSHIDADGIASASIICGILSELGAPFQLRCLPQLTSYNIEEVCEQVRENSVVVFTDFGSGQGELIAHVSKKQGCQIVIVDHHPPTGSKPSCCLEINPCLEGLDGTVHACSASIAFLVAKSLNTFYREAAELAILGALGDRQDCGDKGSLTGLNQLICEEAERMGILERKIGLRLFGFETRPLVKALEYTTDPLLPGLTGDEGACLKFLKSIGIPPQDNGEWRSASDLTRDEMRRLVTSLIKYLISKGADVNEAERIVGYVYTFPSEPADTPLRDAREAASLLSACGRMNAWSIGVAICLGDREEALMEALEVLKSYRKLLSQLLNELFSGDKLARKGIIYSFHLEDKVDEKVLSAVTSCLFSPSRFEDNSILVGFVNTPLYVKVSARCSPKLARRGFHLGQAVGKAAAAVEGEGGGHSTAAGAQIPLGTEEAFLEALSREARE